MDKEDPFRSILRSDQAFSKAYIRNSSPPHAVQSYLQKEQQRPATGNTRVIVSSKPPTVCVNCSREASLCMFCHELAMGKALLFQRRSTLLGTVMFFKRAVKEAGHIHLVKLVVFRLWRNGFKIRAQEAVRLRKETERRFVRHVAGPPFHAWRRLTVDTALRRKDRKIDELNSKMQQLQDVIKRLNEMVP